jgi:hypothetical protein
MVMILLLSRGRGSFAGLSVAKRSIGVMELESGRCICARSSRSDNGVEADLEPWDPVDDLELHALWSQGQGCSVPKTQAHRVETSPVRTEPVESRSSKLGQAFFRLRHLSA